MKYRNQPSVGKFFGLELGKRLLDSKTYTSIDWVVPVPLHPRKQKQRGYNQCLWIALGISEVLDVPVCSTLIKRVKHSKSQTQMNREERWLNAEQSYTTGDKTSVAGKHILLVDDVITTGATITAIASLFPNSRISVVSLAFEA